MKTRNEILNDVLDLDREANEIQERINNLYEEAKNIQDDDDDMDDSGFSILDNIKSYAM